MYLRKAANHGEDSFGKSLDQVLEDLAGTEVEIEKTTAATKYNISL